MKQLVLASATVLSTIIIMIMVTSVSAYSLEFYYFETNKLVYEVGETIDMVSKVKADFSEDGWCCVSFTIITDQGLVFSDNYFISPSPDIRYLPSSYVIYPNETSPGLIGTQARVIFRIEIYDGASQSAGDTIDINITRGHLDVVPETPLDIEYGTNATLSFRIVSIHNNDVTYCSQMVSLEVLDLNNTLILQEGILSNSQGEVNLLWNSSTAVPGYYNLTLSSNGTASFLPFSQSFQLYVSPAASTLDIVSCPEIIFCQSSDGIYNESVDLVVAHLGKDQIPIESSFVCWKTGFSQGNMTNLGNGQYWMIIEFPVTPGQYSINLTAINPLYQTAYCEALVEVLPRNVFIEVQLLESAISGYSMNARITVNDLVSGTGINNLDLLINATVSEINLDITWKTTNSSGGILYNISIPGTIWGEGVITIIINETIHYSSLRYDFLFNVTFLPLISNKSELMGALGYDNEIQLSLCDPKGEALANISYEFYNPANELILNALSNLNGDINLSFYIPKSLGLGLQRYTLIILAHASQYVSGISQFLNISVQTPLRFVSVNEYWNAIRGKNTTISFMIESEGVYNEVIDFGFYDVYEEFSVLKTITTDVIEVINISIGYHISLGPHVVHVIVEDDNYLTMGVFEFELRVFASFTLEPIIETIYYGETLNFSISLLSDDMIPPTIDISVYFQSCNYSFVIDSFTVNSLYSVNISDKVYPGEHILIINGSSPWYVNTSKILSVFVWMRIKMQITLSILEYVINQGQLLRFENNESNQLAEIASNISLGSIIRPPPILFNGTTSVVPSTDRITSLESWPRLSSGTSNLSTVCAKSLMILSGNGHKNRNLNDLIETEESFIINSSIDLDVHPYDTIPQSAFSGPEIKQSVNNSKLLWILDVIRRIRRL